MKIRKKFLKGLELFREGIEGYPVTILSLVCFVFLSIYNSEVEFKIDGIDRYLMSIFLFVPLSLNIKSIIKNRNKKVYYLLYPLGIGLMIFYCNKGLGILGYEDITRFIGLNIVLFGLFFLYNPYREGDFVNYIISSLGKALISAIYGLFLFLGLVFIFFTVDSLFDLSLRSNIYFYIFLLVFFIFTPVQFLARLDEERNYLDYTMPKALRGLLIYILMPLSLVYIFILYIYFLKIGLTRVFPKGLVSHLVLWYSVLVMIIIFFTENLDRDFVKFYRRFMPILLLPIYFMMFISLSLRIGQYSFTENRYFPLVLGIYLSLASLLLIKGWGSRPKRLWAIFLLFTFLAVLSPVDAYRTSFRAQEKRFYRILEDKDLLRDGVLVKTSLDDKAKEDLYSLLNYFYSRGNLARLSYLPENFKLDNMESVFGFGYNDIIGPANYRYVHLTDDPVIKLEDYDRLFLVDRETELRDGDYSLNYSGQNSSLTIKYKDEEVYAVDLGDLLFQRLRDLSEKDYSLENLTFRDSSERAEVKIVVENLDLDLNQEEIIYLRLYVFFKLR